MSSYKDPHDSVDHREKAEWARKPDHVKIIAISGKDRRLGDDSRLYVWSRHNTCWNLYNNDYQ